MSIEINNTSGTAGKSSAIKINVLAVDDSASLECYERLINTVNSDINEIKIGSNSYITEIGIFHPTKSWTDAIKYLSDNNKIDLILLDVIDQTSGKEAGFEIAKHIREKSLPLEIIFVSSELYKNVDISRTESIRLEYDVLGFIPGEIISKADIASSLRKAKDYNNIKNILSFAFKKIIQKRLSIAQAVANGKRQAFSLQKKVSFDDVIGSESAIEKIKTTMRSIADSEAKVLILGETGTGKSLLAKAIHFGSKRKNRPFIDINCAAIPEQLLESELFGYEKGAFTGAVSRKEGLIFTAEGGTFLMDEIGDMPLSLQAKLLKALEGNEVIPVGGTQPRRFDVRFIFATNKDIVTLKKVGSFNQALYRRIAVITLVVPPLRERGRDILILAKNFLNKFNAIYQKSILSFDATAEDAMQKYSWPENVGELSNAVERAVLLTSNKYISIEDLTIDIVPESQSPPSGFKKTTSRKLPDWVKNDITDTQLKKRLEILLGLELCIPTPQRPSLNEQGHLDNLKDCIFKDFENEEGDEIKVWDIFKAPKSPKNHLMASKIKAHLSIKTKDEAEDVFTTIAMLALLSGYKEKKDYNKEKVTQFKSYVEGIAKSFFGYPTANALYQPLVRIIEFDKKCTSRRLTKKECSILFFLKDICNTIIDEEQKSPKQVV
jgi:DNA-binding NtrC family response regulator